MMLKRPSNTYFIRWLTENSPAHRPRIQRRESPVVYPRRTGVSHRWAITGQSQPHVIVQCWLSYGQFHTFVTAGKAQVQKKNHIYDGRIPFSRSSFQSPVSYGDSLSPFHGLLGHVNRTGPSLSSLATTVFFLPVKKTLKNDSVKLWKVYKTHAETKLVHFYHQISVYVNDL